MRTESRRQLGWAAAWALAFVVGGPELARAQQSGLFPLAPIQRERVPCAAEDPVYRLYRHQYFGYHPTCWRRFPAGWGCPSPEAPNPAESFRALPRDTPPTDGGADAGPETVPGTGDEAMPGAAAPRPGTPNPSALPPLPNDVRSPFELDNAPGTPPASDRPADATAPKAPTDESSAPAVRPAPTTPAPSTPPGASAARGPRGEEPLLGLPDPTVVPQGGEAAQPVQTVQDGAGTPGYVAPGVATPAPAQAPRRTSVISSLFSGRAFRRR